ACFTMGKDEKSQTRNIGKEDRSKLVSQALTKMKGKIHEITSSHVSCRVLQTCAKYCSQDEINVVYLELKLRFLTLACNTDTVHLITKMLDNGVPAVLQPILEKGITDHSILHMALVEYLTIDDKTSAADVVRHISTALLVQMIHTKDGSKVGILCIKHGSAQVKVHRSSSA
ncbi:pumilio homolog 24, partial [Tanacetum coccineum]